MRTDEAFVTYHIANILSAAPQCVGLTLIVNADQERLLANVAPIILGILTVGKLLDMGLLAMRMVLLGLLVLLLVLRLPIWLLIVLVLLVLVLLVRVLPRTHLDKCDARVVEEKLVSEVGM